MVLHGSHSDYSGIESGVPQALFLVPYYFLFISMTLKETLNPISSFFADDTMILSLVKDPEFSANYLNHDLDTIRQWADQWKLKFNPDPTKQATDVLFSCKIT